MIAADPLYAVSCDVEPFVDQTRLFSTFHRSWIGLRSGGIGCRVNTWNLCLSPLNHVQCIFHLSSTTSSSSFSSLSYGRSFVGPDPLGHTCISEPCPCHSFLFLPWNSVDRPNQENPTRAAGLEKVSPICIIFPPASNKPALTKTYRNGFNAGEIISANLLTHHLIIVKREKQNQLSTKSWHSPAIYLTSRQPNVMNLVSLVVKLHTLCTRLFEPHA